MSDITMLIPNKRTRFFNKNNPDAKNNQPTFKACYIGRGLFTKQIIGVDIPDGVKL